MEQGGFRVSVLRLCYCRCGELRAQLGFDQVRQRARLRLQCPGTMRTALVTGPPPPANEVMKIILLATGR